jgi:hypothetical protein
MHKSQLSDRDLGHHHLEEALAGNIKGNTQKNIGTSLIKLKA